MSSKANQTRVEAQGLGFLGHSLSSFPSLIVRVGENAAKAPPPFPPFSIGSHCIFHKVRVGVLRSLLTSHFWYHKMVLMLELRRSQFSSQRSHFLNRRHAAIYLFHLACCVGNNTYFTDLVLRTEFIKIH